MWLFFFFSSRRRHTRCSRDWSSDVCSSDLAALRAPAPGPGAAVAGVPEPAGAARGVALLRRFAAYVERHWGLRARLPTLRDSRRRPQIAAARVWLCVFAMFVVRLRSFHALEQALRQLPGWRAWLGPGRLPIADTLGRGLARLDLPALRALGATVNRRAWRGTRSPRPGGGS